MWSEEMLKKFMMSNEEIGDKEQIKQIRLDALETAETLRELAIARVMAKYGTCY